MNPPPDDDHSNVSEVYTDFPSMASISTELVGPQFSECDRKYNDIVNGENGKLYLVPYDARKVVSFDPKNDQWIEIGQDFGLGGGKWDRGLLAENGKIYCSPSPSGTILVIDTATESTQLVPLPPAVRYCKIFAHTSDKKGSIYFFLWRETKVIKMDTTTHELSTINCDEGRWWIFATHVSNGCIYIPPLPNYGANYILEFNPDTETVSTIELYLGRIDYKNNYSPLVEHGNGHLYAISKRNIIIVNIATSAVSSVDHDCGAEDWNWWSKCIIGNDGCIYAMPSHYNYILRYDPTNSTTTVTEIAGDGHWFGMCLGDNKNIYCAPSRDTQILKIILPTNHWICLKHRLLIHNKRATAIDLSLEEEENDDCKVLAIIQKFIAHMNDDEFRHVLGFF